MSAPLPGIDFGTAGEVRTPVRTPPHAREAVETGARILAVDIGAHGAAALLDLLRREIRASVDGSTAETGR